MEQKIFHPYYKYMTKVAFQNSRENGVETNEIY